MPLSCTYLERRLLISFYIILANTGLLQEIIGCWRGLLGVIDVLLLQLSDWWLHGLPSDNLLTPPRDCACLLVWLQLHHTAAYSNTGCP